MSKSTENMSKNLRKTIKYQGEKLEDLNIWKAVYSVLSNLETQ